MDDKDAQKSTSVNKPRGFGLRDFFTLVAGLGVGGSAGSALNHIREMQPVLEYIQLVNEPMKQKIDQISVDVVSIKATLDARYEKAQVVSADFDKRIAAIEIMCKTKVR